MRRISLFLVGMMMLFQACDIALSPKDYESEIEDAAKFYVAAADLTAEVINDGHEYTLNLLTKDDGLLNQADEMYTKNDLTYYQTLLEISQWNDTYEKKQYAKLAKRLVKLYDETDVKFTDYELVNSSSKKKIWKFKELNSDMEFTFMFENIESDNFTWSVEALDHSIQKYLESQVY